MPDHKLDLSRVSREALEALARWAIATAPSTGPLAVCVTRIRAEATALLCYEGDCAKMTGRARPCPVHDAPAQTAEIRARLEAELVEAYRLLELEKAKDGDTWKERAVTERAAREKAEAERAELKAKLERARAELEPVAGGSRAVDRALEALR